MSPSTSYVLSPSEYTSGATRRATCGDGVYAHWTGSNGGDILRGGVIPLEMWAKAPNIMR